MSSQPENGAHKARTDAPADTGAVDTGAAGTETAGTDAGADDRLAAAADEGELPGVEQSKQDEQYAGGDDSDRPDTPEDDALASGGDEETTGLV